MFCFSGTAQLYITIINYLDEYFAILPCPNSIPLMLQTKRKSLTEETCEVAVLAKVMLQGLLGGFAALAAAVHEAWRSSVREPHRCITFLPLEGVHGFAQHLGPFVRGTRTVGRGVSVTEVCLCSFVHRRSERVSPLRRREVSSSGGDGPAPA